MADKKTAVFDWDTGEFKTDLLGRVVTATQADAVEQIVIKAQQTPRGVYTIYADPDDPDKDHKYGSDVADVLTADVPESVRISEISRAIREALIYDPWINDVTGITVTRDGTDAVTADATIDHVYGTTVIEGGPVNG